MKKGWIGLACVGMLVATAMQAMGGLIISQYYEGASNNKWIEIYNPDASAVDLSAGGYRLGIWANVANREGWKTDAVPTSSMALSNSIPAGGVFLIKNSSAVLPSYATADMAWASLNFNGDDSVVLYTGATYAFANVVDAVGMTGSNGVDRSFVRNSSITAGVNTDFNAADWIEEFLPAVDGAAEGVNLRLGYHSTGAATFGVTLDKTDGFTVDQGSSSAITATAANGTSPYTYAWSSSLGASFYSTNANVFTILATAPTGSYSATVTASDSAAQSTNKTVTFSIVAPAPKYAIAIVPATNGTVTTTPATEAAAGATVTIHATPAGGYAVATYSVVGADTTVIGTTSSFVMPAQAVTVTVTFQEAAAGGALIISQYYEGSGSFNKWIEIYNPGASAIDLAAGEYRLGTWNNAAREGWKTNGAATLTVVLSNSIPAGGTYLVSPATADLPAYATANQTAALAFNGDDSVVLYTGSSYAFANVVDAFGVTNTATSFGENKSFVRTNTVTSGVTGDFNPAEWIQFTTNAVDTAAEATNERLGYHSSGAAVFTVALDKSNGFTVDQGSSSTITATAVNGASPYTYVWGSTLGAGFYSTNANVFTILATAPTGSYSATVTATDSAAQSTNKSVTFSVVAAAPKYAIAIAPAANGTVTTTPATEAAAGTPVTINATPAGGFAVATYSVVGADTTVIGTTSSFVMPAQAVTVTVTFQAYTGPNVLIDFETNTTLSGSAYTAGTSTVNNVSFAHQRVLRGSLENDRKNGGYSGRFYPQTGTGAFLRTTAAFAQPIEKLSFRYANYGSDNGTTFKVQVSSNGADWTDVGSTYDPESTNLVEAVITGLPANSTYFQFVSVAGTVRVNIDDIGVFYDSGSSPTVSIVGDMSGTVGTQMDLAIALQNGTAADWNIDLKDPDGLDDFSYAFDFPGTGAFSFTPSKVGTYTLWATALDGAASPIASNSVTLTVSAAAANPPIAGIAFVAGTGFTFQVPAGYDLVRVEGADTVVAGNALTWLLLSSPTDYSVSGTTVTIKSAAAARRLVRIVLTPS